MRLLIEIDDRASARLESLAGGELDEARRHLVEDGMQLALETTIELNPVDTARSRAAWAAALTKAGGEPPPGWRGPHPQGGAIAEGWAAGRLERRDEDSISEMSAGNGVSYVGFLEYGTSRMAPFAMVRQALVATQQAVRRLFEFPRE